MWHKITFDRLFRLSQNARAHSIHCCPLLILTIRRVNTERFVAAHFLKPCYSILLLSTGAASKRSFPFSFLVQHCKQWWLWASLQAARRTALLWIIAQRVVVIPYRRFGTTCWFVITQKSAVLSGGCVCQPTFPPIAAVHYLITRITCSGEFKRTQTVRQFSPPTVTPSSLVASVFLNTLSYGVQDTVRPSQCP
jgi:hypothetical protein